MKATSSLLCAGLASATILSGCASMNRTEKGALLGTAAGAGVGAIWGAARGNAAEGALIGAAAGAAVGGSVGYYLDRQAKELQEAGIQAQRQKDNTLLVTMSGESLKFDTGRSTIKPEGQAELDKVVGVLKKYPKDRILIGGHTDNKGGASVNQALSQHRAEAVRDYALYKGLDAGAVVSTTGYGDSQPVASNATADGRAQNRRVELKISIPDDNSDQN
jgi:outer membrane protein OmpA-like peptidoglycan-associated protein